MISIEDDLFLGCVEDDFLFGLSASKMILVSVVSVEDDFGFFDSFFWFFVVGPYAGHNSTNSDAHTGVRCGGGGGGGGGRGGGGSGGGRGGGDGGGAG